MTQETPARSKTKENQHASRFSARFYAVQGVYESLINQNRIKDIAATKLQDIKTQELAGEDEENEQEYELVAPDGALFLKVMEGVEEHHKMLDDIIMHHKTGSGSSEKALEPLLKALCLCGLYELYAHHEIDTPIIINDYLDVAYSYYQKGEIALLNGILDSAAATLRSA